MEHSQVINVSLDTLQLIEQGLPLPLPLQQVDQQEFKDIPENKLFVISEELSVGNQDIMVRLDLLILI